MRTQNIKYICDTLADIRFTQLSCGNFINIQYDEEHDNCIVLKCESGIDNMYWLSELSTKEIADIAADLKKDF